MPPPLEDDIVEDPPQPTGNGFTHRRWTRPVARVLPIMIAIAILGVAGAVLSLPVRYPSVVNTFATIAPANKWVLTKATDGQLIASSFNYRSGMSEGFRVSTFSAGGSVYFSLHPSVVPGRMVAIGDTIGTIYSSEVAERLITLNGQLAAARSALAVNATGQKSAVVNEAEQRLQFAKRRREEHRKIEERNQLLYDQHLIAQNEYDRIQNEAHALEDEIFIAQSNLESARTGAKPEQLELANANISALESEISALQARAGTYTLTAPIAGVVTPTFSGTDLLTITAKDYIALITIPWIDYQRVATTPEPHLTFRGLSRTVDGTLLGMNRELQLMNGQQVLIATARVDSPPEDVMPGMLVRCQITCTPLTAAEYGTQLLHWATVPRPSMGTF